MKNKICSLQLKQPNHEASHSSSHNALHMHAFRDTATNENFPLPKQLPQRHVGVLEVKHFITMVGGGDP